MIDKTSLVIAFFVAAVLAGVFVKYVMPTIKPASKENFMQKEVGMPLNAGGMGPYDGAGLGSLSSEALPVGASPANSHDDPNKLMLLYDNEVSASCCPSAFVKDNGCVCLSDSEKKFMASRGGNRA